MIKLSEKALYALGLEKSDVDALRHFLHMVGTAQDGQTLPETVMQVGLNSADSSPAAIAELRKEFETSRVQVPNATAVAELQKEIASVRVQLSAIRSSAAELAELRKELHSLAVAAIFPAQQTDWEHPGKLGDKAPNTVKATTLNVDPAGTVGTVLLPAAYLAADTTTGLYRPALNQWGLTVSALNVVTWSATGALYKQNVSTEKQLISTVAIGTAPLVVTSATKVPNLYVDRAALADTATILTAPTTYPANATDLPTVITLANALKAANISKGV